MRPLVVLVAFFCLVILVSVAPLRAGEVPQTSNYVPINPIRSGNLTVFPVTAGKSYDTAEFLTLDEGLRSGDVLITEAGQARGLIRRAPAGPNVRPPVRDAQVNQLVLVNNSKRPLLLLAGEVVTGGKQDRVIGKDRIVPPESDPVDLGVFCVEPGRWTAVNGRYEFGSGHGSGAGGGMAGGVVAGVFAAPAVRSKAMADKNQQEVWNEVGKSKEAMAALVSPAAVPTVNAQTSYASVISNNEVEKKINEVAAPVEHNYESVIRQLREKNAVGVVVALNGDIIWADIFASSQLLQKYWPKLIRSYATEAVITRAKGGIVSVKDAQGFLDNLQAWHETADIEPGVYRQTELTGDGFKVFELTSLLPKTGFALHIAKMAD